jgi:hypothetical protein
VAVTGMSIYLSPGRVSKSMDPSLNVLVITRWPRVVTLTLVLGLMRQVCPFLDKRSTRVIWPYLKSPALTRLVGRFNLKHDIVTIFLLSIHAGSGIIYRVDPIIYLSLRRTSHDITPNMSCIPGRVPWCVSIEPNQCTGICPSNVTRRDKPASREAAREL